jgi:hypothetical protein
MEDEAIIRHIGALADEERRLEESHASSSEGLSEEERQRLESLQVTLDQLWDVLRQRRALRHAGKDPDAAIERSAETVEHYWQ